MIRGKMMSNLMSFEVLAQQHHVQSKHIIYPPTIYVKQNNVVLKIFSRIFLGFFYYLLRAYALSFSLLYSLGINEYTRLATGVRLSADLTYAAPFPRSTSSLPQST